MVVGVRVRACARARVPSLIQRRHIACGLSGSTKFFDIISQTARFSGKVTEHKICVLIFYTNLFETFLIPSTIQCDIVINVKTS